MVTGSSAAAPARRQTKLAQGKRNAGLMEHLRLVARQHQVCYEIWPLWSTSQGVRTEKGFELLLCGVNGHVFSEGNTLHAVPCCEHCAHTYYELKEIAQWVLDMKKPPAAEIYSFDRALHLAPPHRKHRSEIVMTTAIFHQSEHKPGDSDCESECLKEVRARLSKLGIREDVLFTQQAANA